MGFENRTNLVPVHTHKGCVQKPKDSPTAYETVHRTVSYPRFARAGLSNPDTDQKKNEDRPDGQSSFLVGVSGFEPEASWTRTKRDTKLRHTPIANVL